MNRRPVSRLTLKKIRQQDRTLTKAEAEALRNEFRPGIDIFNETCDRREREGFLDDPADLQEEQDYGDQGW